MFAVFFIKDGAWKLYCEYDNIETAKRELKYLVKELSLNAKVFKRNV